MASASRSGSGAASTTLSVGGVPWRGSSSRIWDEICRTALRTCSSDAARLSTLRSSSPTTENRSASVWMGCSSCSVIESYLWKTSQIMFDTSSRFLQAFEGCMLEFGQPAPMRPGIRHERAGILLIQSLKRPDAALVLAFLVFAWLAYLVLSGQPQ